MKDMIIAVTAASYSGNKGAAAMLQSSLSQLREIYGERLKINLMSVYPKEDARQCPHDFVSIIPSQPWQLIFFAFPCAALYRFLSWCPPVKFLLLKNKMLKAYADTTLVVDEAGIAFSDSRGAVMNTYAFVCGAVPMLMGVPLVKYSQALGPFHNPYNRFLAAQILPKAELVIARGNETYRNLQAAGMGKNVKLCADGAFTMPADKAVARRVQAVCKKTGFSNVVGLSVSSVVARRCKKAGINYSRIMVAFIAYLTRRGYRVYMFANAARIGSDKPRNNDLMIGDAIYQEYQKAFGWQREKTVPDSASKKAVRDKEKKICCSSGAGFVNGLFWEHREMDAEEIREYIAHCRLLIASRFHAMVFALSGQVPVMLIGWSHKYQEVMEQFGLGAYVADYATLSLAQLRKNFEMLIRDEEIIRRKLSDHLSAVQKSSRQNVSYITQVLNRIEKERDGQCKKNGSADRIGKGTVWRCKKRTRRQYLNRVIDLNRPEKYIGPYISCRMGYAADAALRTNAASGGMVTALLCSLLKNHDIDGAWVVKTAFTQDGRLAYHTFIATTPEQIRDASSSVYMKIPMMAHIEQLRRFQGRLAVALTPCMMHAFLHVLEKDDTLRQKIVLKIGLFCSGGHDSRAAEFAMDKRHISRAGAKRLYYRRGHWRGISSVVYEDGSQKDFSYQKTICAYKNAYFFLNPACLGCQDQFAKAADISFGDVWLGEMKKEPVKYTGCVIRTKKAQAFLQRGADQGDLILRDMSDTQMLRSQKRALTFKFRGQRWNHRLAGFLAAKNQQFSIRHPKALKRIPMTVVYYYMCFIRVLLSW